MSAVESISPAIQKAASDPYNAASMLMAAAAAFTGNSAAPSDSKNVASAVNDFVAQPAAAHVPAPGAVPGVEAHLPAGVDPAHAVGRRRKPCRRPRPRLHLHRRPMRAPAPAPAPDGSAGCAAGGRRNPAVRSGRPADAGLHVPVDQQRLPEGRRQCARDGDLGGRAGQDSGARARGRARRPTCSPRSARPAPAAEQKLPLNVTWVNLTTGKSGSADAQAAVRTSTPRARRRCRRSSTPARAASCRRSSARSPPPRSSASSCRPSARRWCPDLAIVVTRLRDARTREAQ